MTSANSKRAIREFMDVHPDINYTTALRLSKAPHRFALAERNWTEKSDIVLDWLAEPTAEQCEYEGGEDETWFSLGQVFAPALNVHSIESLNRAHPGTEEFEGGRFRIVEMVCHQDRWLVWRERHLVDALGPDGAHALALDESVEQGEFQAGREYKGYCHLAELVPDLLWNRDHAAKALRARYGDTGGSGFFGLGSDQLPDECVAVLARHLIGSYPYWTQADYDRATFNYRVTYGQLHPDDARLPLVNAVRDIRTREDWDGWFDRLTGGRLTVKFHADAITNRRALWEHASSAYTGQIMENVDMEAGTFTLRPDVLLTGAPFKPEVAKATPGLAFGLTEGDQVVSLPNGESLLISGGCGGVERTMATRALVASALEKGWQVYLIDWRRQAVDYGDYVPRLAGCATGMASAYRMLTDLTAKIEVRQSILVRDDRRALSEDSRSEKTTPILLVFEGDALNSWHYSSGDKSRLAGLDMLLAQVITTGSVVNMTTVVSIDRPRHYADTICAPTSHRLLMATSTYAARIGTLHRPEEAPEFLSFVPRGRMLFEGREGPAIPMEVWHTGWMEG